jgi:hypothetical protein
MSLKPKHTTLCVIPTQVGVQAPLRAVRAQMDPGLRRDDDVLFANA